MCFANKHIIIIIIIIINICESVRLIITLA